ncbi:MAG TPA: sigma factor [Phycisphaerales bacterium]|nr:sigma factor [Phycisphaerales bacterium]
MANRSIDFRHPVHDDMGPITRDEQTGSPRVRWRIRPSVNVYVDSVQRAPRLTAPDERQLGWKIINDGCELSSTTLLRSNLRLVVTIAEHYKGRGASLPDLIVAGNTGLQRAVADFDPAIGTRFSTYASWWIKQSMKQVVRGVEGHCSHPRLRLTAGMATP